MSSGHPLGAAAQDRRDLRRRHPVALERLDQRGDLIGGGVRQPVAFLVGEQTPPPPSRPRHQHGRPSGLGLLPPEDPAVSAELPRGSELSPAPRTRVRATSRLVRRATAGQGLLRRQPLTMPIGASEKAVDSGQMNTETLEPLPTLVTQDPAVR